MTEPISILRPTGRYTCAEVKAITLDHLADIRRKIADLRRLEQTLADVAGKRRGGIHGNGHED